MRKARSQPSFLFSQMRRLHPIACPQFLHRCGKMIAYRPFGQRKACGDLRILSARERCGEYLPLSMGQGIVSLGEGQQGQFGINDALSLHHTP